MSKPYICVDCGPDDIRNVVRHGSFIVMCARCRQGPATSFLTVGPRLEGAYRASVVDEDWKEVGFVAEGSGDAFLKAVGAAAGRGELVELKRTRS